MIRKARLICAAAIAAAAASPLQAATMYWQGGTGALISPNYNDGTNSGLTPTNADFVNFGNGGTGNHTSGSGNIGRLRVGMDNQAPGNGNGTVNVNNGATLTLAGATGAANAGLTIGRNRNGTVTISGANSNITVGRLAIVGYGNDLTRTAALNVNNSGSLTLTNGNLILGEATPTTGHTGVPGVVSVNGGTITISEGGADLNIGAASATSSFTQVTGATSIGDEINIGSGSSTGSFLRVQGGTFESRTGPLFVGRGTSVDATLYLENGTLSTAGNVTVGGGSSVDATANISGGTLSVGGRYLSGTATSTDSVTNHSAGIVNIGLDLRVADTLATAAAVTTYNLSGTGILNTNVAPLPADPLTTSSIIGRQGTGHFFQTGGTANFNSPLRIGSKEGTGAAATGLYQISAGDMNVSTAASALWPNALTIGSNGTGELRVIGDDATIDVTGNFSASSTSAGDGTLAFVLEDDELVSMINVSGSATFGAGTKLVFDASNAPITQYYYNVLTAASITDLGIDYTGPAGSYYRIVELQDSYLLQIVIPEPSALGLMLVAAIGGLFRYRGR